MCSSPLKFDLNKDNHVINYNVQRYSGHAGLRKKDKET